MKVWGELTDAEGTLRSDSRVLDLLNVRYLLVRPGGRPRQKSQYSTLGDCRYEGNASITVIWDCLQSKPAAKYPS